MHPWVCLSARSDRHQSPGRPKYSGSSGCGVRPSRCRSSMSSSGERIAVLCSVCNQDAPLAIASSIMPVIGVCSKSCKQPASGSTCSKAHRCVHQSQMKVFMNPGGGCTTFCLQFSHGIFARRLFVGVTETWSFFGSQSLCAARLVGGL